jgi:uridine phosphorylase
MGSSTAIGRTVSRNSESFPVWWQDGRPPVPKRLRPTAPIAADAILAGDPGRALLLAQELLEQPKMSNHARGLWGYGGTTPEGRRLTIQATGMGGPSAAIVLADLAKLGVRRAVRIGSCAVPAATAGRGELLLVEEAIAAGGSAAEFGLAIGESVRPEEALAGALREALEDARPAAVASFDSIPADASTLPAGADAADMQTVAVLSRAPALGISAAAVLIVAETIGDGPEAAAPAPLTAPAADEVGEEAAKRAGRAVRLALGLYDG